MANDTQDEDLLYPPPPESLRDTLEARHRVIYETDVDGNTVLCRRLTQVEMDRIKAMIDNPRHANQAGAQMFRDAVVYPEGDALKQLQEDYPMAADRVAEDLLRWSRGEAVKQGKKSRRRSAQPG